MGACHTPARAGGWLAAAGKSGRVVLFGGYWVHTLAYCSIDGCTKTSHARGFCPTHYRRFRLYGSPFGRKKKDKPSPMEWLLAHKDYAESECLTWPYSSKKGRGLQPQINLGSGKNAPAARVMCILKNGEPPTQKHQCAHSCGKGHLACVNPSHLRWATPRENQLDRVIHGTDNRGNKHPQRKLSEDIVREIRRRCKETHAALSREYGVGISTICHVRRGSTWGHVI